MLVETIANTAPRIAGYASIPVSLSTYAVTGMEW